MRTNPCKIIPTSESPAEIWINWHKSLKKWFSKNETNMHWLRFWQQRAGAESKADTHSLRVYMEKQGVNLTTDTMGEITDGVASAFDWYMDSMKIAKFLIVGTVVVGVGLVAYYVIKSSNQGKSIAEMAFDVKTLGKGKLLTSKKLLN